jgi:AmpE protein
MNFLVLLLVLLLEKFSAARDRVQRDDLFAGLLRRLEARPAAEQAPWQALVLLALLPVALLWLLLMLLEPLAYGWLVLPVHVLVLLFGLGRGDVLVALGPFRDAWRRGDIQGAYHAAQRDLGLDAQDDAELLGKVQQHLVWQAYQGFFAVIFWYALLGPLVVLLYRLLALLEERAGGERLRGQAGQLRHALDWLPARALAASFALVGHFEAVSRTLLHELLNWNIAATGLLARTAAAALDLDEPAAAGADGVLTLDRLWQLLVRCALLWYVVFALWALL